ncbi:MAG: hypothetical protein IKX21_06045, partial [Deltaproteobacteria bacterium]|nr:hypothetical protein [Deltaproteobacteria bacterium]
NAFVGRILGNWSSHPRKLALQRKVFFLLGLLPVGVGLFLAFLVVTNYRASDFAGVHNWSTFIAALRGLWAKIARAAKILLCAGFATFGFSLTLNLLWAVSRTLSRVKGQAVRGRDELPFPAWVVFVFCFFWLIPPILQIWKAALTAVDWRLYALAQIIANALCFLPFFALLCWTACAGQKRSCGEGEIRRHPFGHLFLALLLFAAGGGVLCVPEPAFFGRLVASQFGWISNCGLTAGRVFRYVRFVLSSLLFVLGVFHLLLWRLKYVYKTRKRTSAVSGEDGKTADDDGVPACARYLLGHLPPEITLDGKIEKVHVKEFSPPMQGEDPYGLAFIMGGSVPTADQFDFFRRFVTAHDAACASFEEMSDPSQPTMTADMILQGPDGSGRTEILLAAAMYAAIARGQRVLYMVPGRENAKVLAARINVRLADLKVECYFSADYLRILEVDSWLDPQSGKAPPDILFATPEAVERAFFSNTSTLVPEKREAMRGLLVGFGAVFVDDFLEMALSVRSHVAFQLDKFRLLQ